MKGCFSLNLVGSSIIFGNLGREDADGFSILELGYYSDPNGYARACSIIAHDVIEHSKKHRTNKVVTVQEEIRALGAVMFVRPNNFDVSEVAHILSYLSSADYRPLPPKRTLTCVDAEDILEAMEDADMTPDARTAEWAAAQLAYGYWQKKTQFKGSQVLASMAYDFIRNESASALELLEYSHQNVIGVTCSFDTEEEIFKIRRKYLQ